ncbi:uncharacterized protein LAESUDRAFT_655686 [Laetiporus sulphureus 93-53]|uniref:Origin recognition complex subunit 4 n=1 Tax=Laetiporus sulphureus 93-53 TaxID=1314785 RepID=A0A165DSA1_9APHY|nr:uncharacterized protein LAESUDRAFT_655686 [Laetiporus sulphureus 93-53]KZT05526.1 hypothetical protein LAESUDRAFT_655686 [Laetiporus sulphureus 93-53]
MACVEISSPGRRAFNESSSVHSSRPQSGLRHLLQAPVRAPSPSPVKRPTGQSTPSTQGPELPQRSSSSRRKALPQPIFPSLPRSPPSSPTKRFLSLATLTPSPWKPRGEANVQVSPSRKGRGIPPRLYPYLEVQKRAILKALRNPPEIEEEAGTELEDDGPSTNSIAYEQLSDLLKGTVVRGEGNSCLLIGPRGSGKTRIVEKAITALPDNPIVIRLSGHAQQNDRVAIREIARQLTQQTGSSFLQTEEDKLTDDAFNDPEDPFIDRPEVATDTTLSIALPPPAHLLALISMIPTLTRATIVVIDGFDQFATHARQSLLYCLLDTAQSCRAAKGNKGLAIIGVTTRVDTINLLEKRVKSRFSGRMLRTACPCRVEDWLRVSRSMLTAPIETEADDEWNGLWATTVDRFLKRDAVVDVLRDTFELTRDVRTLCRILTPVVVELSPEAPTLSASTLDSAAGIQRCPSRFPFLPALSYPALSLLVAAMHAQTSGHDAFTFEMLHESFRDQVRTSLSAPVQVDGGSVGMLQCSRNAFEHLVSLRAFVAATPSTSTSREFVLYRCAIDRFDVKTAVDQSHQTLKKWLNKAQ